MFLNWNKNLRNFWLDIKTLTLAILFFLINIPFGYWRANTKSKSLEWFLTIHIPIIIILLIRFLFGVDFSLISFLMNASAFILGQYTGKKLNLSIGAKVINRTSCLFIDLKEYFINHKWTNIISLRFSELKEV